MISDRRVWLAVLLGAVAVVSLMISNGATRTPPPGTPSPVMPAATVSPGAPNRTAPTEDAYRESVREALAPLIKFRADAGSGLDDRRGEEELSVVRAAKGAVLAVVVPTGARDAHLDLALVLTEIEDGISDGDGKLWARGEKGLDDFLKDNDWATAGE